MILLFAGVLLPLGVFVALADEVHALEDLYFDEPLLWSMRGLTSPGWDRFFTVVTEAGYQYGVIPLDTLIVWCCWACAAGARRCSRRCPSSVRRC